MYKPPFDLDYKMLDLSTSIAYKIGKMNYFNSLKRMPTLRRNNKIMSIHSSLKIEANSLSLDQVRDVINGKEVIGPKKEILEVKNAFEAYEKISTLNPYSEKDLLLAHRIIVKGINDDAGKYRNHGEGVYDGSNVVFVAPPEKLVPKLMSDLFSWLKEDNETSLLIKSCVFHYEFVFIHPFSDGNGRMARLWQNVLLYSWNPIFEYLPIESQIQEYQEEYYKVISICNKSGNSNEFIVFMLKVIDETLSKLMSQYEKESLSISDKVTQLLNVLEKDRPLSANEIMERLKIKSKETLRGSYLNPAIENGLVKMTLPDKPNSKNQKYYLANLTLSN